MNVNPQESFHDIELSAKRSQVVTADEERLEHLGYEPELKRTFGLFSMVGFSFSILTCWTTISGTMSETMLNGGPVALVYGWIGACAFSLCVAVSMAEICSAYPVAGGQYSWCLLLTRGTKWGRACSYICGWVQLAGIVCIAASAIYQFGLGVSGMAYINTNGNFELSIWKLVVFAYACIIANAIVAIFANRFLHYLTAGILYWSLGGFIICMVVLLVRAPSFQSPGFVFTQSFHESGWNQGMSIILGCMQPAYSIATYDSVAHLSEELVDASREAPKAMVLSVIIGFITGFGFILTLLFSIQDIEAVVNTPTQFPLVEIVRQAVHNEAALMCLSVIVVVCGFVASQSLLVESSRSVYAFARDGAFPWKLNDWLSTVDTRLDTPVWAILVCMAFEMIFVAIRFGSSAAFSTVLSIATAGLYVSYLLPVTVSMLRYKHKAPGYYNLGKWAPWIQGPGILYLIFCTIFFFFPTALPVDASNMNYCIVAFGIVAVFGIVSWFGGARHTYVRNTEKESLDAAEGTATDDLGTKPLYSKAKQ